MQTCSICGHSFEAERCPFCVATYRKAMKVSMKYVWVLGAGFVAGRLLDKFCPLLEWPMATTYIILALFFVPLVLLFFSFPGPGFVQRVERLKRASIGAAALMVIYVAFNFLNIVLDKEPPIDVPARVVSMGSGRASRIGGTAYALDLSLLWNQKPLEEEFLVTHRKFSDVETGDLIDLQVHQGAFFLAWYDSPIK